MIFRFFFRCFIKITGLIPFLLILKPKFYYSSYRAKKEGKKNHQEGAIIISNHTSVFDYYVMLYKYVFSFLHTMVLDIIYRSPFLPLLNWVMGNIKINSNDPSNLKAILKAKKYLLAKKHVLIYPEGHLEHNPGEIIHIKNSAILLAWETKSPIIPYFTDGRYGLFHRPGFIRGEKIYLHKIINKTDLNQNDIENLKKYLVNVLLDLKRKMFLMKKHQIFRLFSSKFVVLDLAKFISPPWHLIFPTKTVYMGNKKEIRHLLKDNVIIASNHQGVFDPICLTLTFWRRRLRIVAQEELWNKPFMRFSVEHSGVIKYRRVTMNKFDIKFVLETREILEARGAVGIYPEGHILNNVSFQKPLMSGLAMLSLVTRSPIIPMLTGSRYAKFKLTKIAIGEPIYPEKYFDYSRPIDSKIVEEYNDYIYDKMKNIFNCIKDK